MRNQYTTKTRSVWLRCFNSKLIFPALLCVWFLYFNFAKTKPKSLRGNGPAFDTSLIYEEKSITTPNTIENLVVVAGHAVLRLNKLSTADRYDSGWYLLPYQLNQGFPAIITSHIKTGVSLTKHDSRAMLVFSGGQTRRDVGPTSEAASYYYLANEKKWMTQLQTQRRVYLEEYARDSYENLLFSVCRFREVTGFYPKKITVVGFDFKGQRFTELHRAAIGYPAANFSYVGVKSPRQFDQNKAVRIERDAFNAFKNDLYGCEGRSLAIRKERNPFKRTSPYPVACPEVAALLHWCGPNRVDSSSLPWHVT